ncbi:flagellar basal body rod protein FlgG [Savagea faecisuis]|uniref:Flagellar hook protein FlgE n=1 Tax=Savagea faecisuis TaxID=1274803 RepID=A0ABW3GWZ1_9BACL
MLRSMYSGISGLKNFQTKLDVIGNNIANVNTHGFKKGRVIFKDLYSQTVAGASGPSASRGGVNPKQVGLGAQLGAIDTIHAGGSTQFTGNTLDLAIEGDGFFVVAQADGESEPKPEQLLSLEKPLYTRAGNFYMDENGYIVNSDGYYLVGNADPVGEEKLEGGEFDDNNYVNIQIPLDAESMSIGDNGEVTYVKDGELKPAGYLVMATFNNPGGLEKVGANYYQVSPNSGDAAFASPTISGMGATKSGSLEMSNVDLGEEFTEMIVAQRGFQANTRIITTSDEILQELVNLKR